MPCLSPVIALLPETCHRTFVDGQRKGDHLYGGNPRSSMLAVRNAVDVVTVLRGGGLRPPGGDYKIHRLSRGSLNQRVRSSLAGSVVIVRVKSRCDSVRKDFFTNVFSEFCFKPSTCLNTALVLLRGDQKEGTGVFPVLAELPCRV